MLVLRPTRLGHDMNDEALQKAHWSFWLIAAVALLWNLAGTVNFFVQMNPDMTSAYRDVERVIIEERPAWATLAFAIAVIGGTLGCLLLLFRKSVAIWLLVLSLLGVIVTMVHTLRLDVEFGIGEVLGIILMPLVVSVFLVWYAKFADGKRWTR